VLFMLRRRIAGRVLLALLTAVLWTCQTFAQGDCGNVALEHIFKAQIDEATLETAFNRLHGLSETGRKGADEVFRASGEANATAVVNDLLNKVTPAQAERIFANVTRFKDEQAKAAIAVVARLPPYDDVDVGESIALYLERKTVTTPGKEKFFKDLALIHTDDGADRLLQRAADQADMGETYTVYVAAEIKRKGDKGNLISADADHGGRDEFEGWKIDVETSEFGIQLKSRVGNGPIDETYINDVENTLDKLVTDCIKARRKPAFASNGNIVGNLPKLLEARGITPFPNYAQIPLNEYP
jgi:hypothetical protein